MGIPYLKLSMAMMEAVAGPRSKTNESKQKLVEWRPRSAALGIPRAAGIFGSNFG